ncbi:MAG: hypothetical protein HY551_05105, partial [Elusimicrobia bacterium]|nr:hypothetical protein [Elusimicrobiota bacterium]
NNWGLRNGVKQTDANGTTKDCEAKMHVCFLSGSADPAIPCTVDSNTECHNACQNANEIACSNVDCEERCKVSRVSGYVNTTCP